LFNAQGKGQALVEGRVAGATLFRMMALAKRLSTP
jgi:hypothetical protein